MKKSFEKIIALSLIVGLNWAGLSTVVGTLAYYNDTETSSANEFSAATLDFSLSSGDWEPAEKAVNLLPGDSVTRNISVVKNGSLNFQYIAGATITAGDESFCNALDLKAEVEGVEKYNNKLKDFNLTTPVAIGNDGQDDWLFTVTLPASSPEFEEASCEFKFIFNSWQETLSQGQGFNDEEELENVLEAGGSTTSGYSPIADAYVNQGDVNSNYGSMPGLQIVSQNNQNRRTFIRFDFHFPDGTNIISSELKLFMSTAPTAPRTYEAKTVAASWTENGIKWNNQPGTDGSATDSVSSGTIKNVWLSWNVTSDVQDFVSGANSNYGWRLGDSVENSSFAYGRFRSKENLTVALRPILEVQFSAPEATTDHLVVNEVYYHVAASKGNDPANEWVEIYNPTDSEVNISGWKICDNSTCDVLPVSAPIPAKGFAVITGHASTWANWTTIPSGAIKIVLSPNSNIGNALANSGDRVILKNASNAIIDAMSYGSDISQFSLYLSGRGKSLARIIKGYDTDSAVDWIINATPNPGTNPSTGGEEIMRFTDDGVEVAGLQEGLESLLTDEQIPEEIITEQEPIQEPVINEPVINEQVATGAGLTGEIFGETTVVEEVVEETPTETVVEEVPVETIPEEVIPEVVPEEPSVIEEQPVVVEETIIEEQPAIEEQPVVVEEPINVEPPPVPPPVDPPAPTE